jgi:hypothetical protein
MSLTAALQAYFADATHSALTEIAEEPEPSTRATAAAIILFGTGALREWAAIMPHLLADVVNAGANQHDLGAVFNGCNQPTTEPRSFEWTAAAMRLAAWADGLAS